ncbi:peroxisomal biogenesis factor 6 [Harmonia axyridis]|uniref:peroxisomal biogenesis factor 6 n=1 Tax=Harmonia axyridis TaxID=115357 RepID=UPI001E275029|nr:peroxisomal biogenesis factor 6 [Harmonia axyridis]
MENKIDFSELLKKREVKLLCYISKILFPGLPSCLYPLYMFIQFCKICQQKREYILRTINPNLLSELIEKSKNILIDENYTVIINNKFLRGRDTIVLKVKYADEFILVNVKPLVSDIVDDGNILVSTTLMFNISNSFGLIHRDYSLSASFIEIPPGKLGFADEIHLALISNPYDLQNNVVDILIKNYLQTPKLMHENDLIEIALKKYAVDVPCNMTKIFNTQQKVYFKCLKVLCKHESKFNIGGNYAVFEETTVRQVANIQSFLPSCKEYRNSLTNNQYNKNNLRFCPSGLENYAAEIEAAVRPFLMKKLKVNPAFLIVGKKGSGKEIIISSIASKFGMHFYKVTNFDITAHVYAQNEMKLRNIFFNANLYAPCILYITNFENFEKNNDGQTDERIISNFTNGLKNLFESNKFPVILFCSSNNDKISPRLKREFLEIFRINPPSPEERTDILKWLLQYHDLHYKNSLEELVQKTNTFMFEDLNLLIRLAKSYNIFSKEKNDISREKLLLAIDYMQLHYNENIGAPKVPTVQWDDIGGLKDVKDEIIKTINFPLKHPEFSTSTGLRRLGILLFGPPGTGKTLLAKAVATECNLCFLSVKGPELLNMYIGQSEENIREVFQRARAASPCIIFFDELDSLAPNRGVSGDSGGVMDRVVSQLLAEMDGINEKATVFIIGATNRPDLIDPALLRPGRFDKLLYVGPATDSISRLSVLKALTRKFNLSEEVNLEDIVELCPNNISGADFYGLCAESWMHAVRRTIHQGSLDIKNITGKEIIVNMDDFKYALSTVTPSVTSEDLLYFEKLKNEISSNI